MQTKNERKDLKPIIVGLYEKYIMIGSDFELNLPSDLRKAWDSFLDMVCDANIPKSRMSTRRISVQVGLFLRQLSSNAASNKTLTIFILFYFFFFFIL